MLIRYLVLAVVVSFTAAVLLPARQADDPLKKKDMPDTADAAAKLAKEAGAVIAKKYPDTKPKVCVFPIGNKEGRVTYDLASASLDLQGELIERLIENHKGRYFVVDRAGLFRLATAAGVTPDGVSTGDPAATAKYLKAIKVEACLVASLSGKTTKDMKEDRKASLTVSVVFDDGTSEQLVGRMDPDKLPVPTPRVTGRLDVAVLFGKEPEKLYVAETPDVTFQRVFFLPLDPKMKGQEYRIRLTNAAPPKGGGGLMWDDGLVVTNPNPEKEKARRFSVALRIDGVNSIYQNRNPRYTDVAGEFKLSGAGNGPVIVHPKRASRWVLEGVGAKYQCYEVPGFQRDGKTSLKFTLADAKDSIAAEAGAMNYVGLIEAHIYAEKLTGDVQKRVFKVGLDGGIGAGTRAGKPKEFPVRLVSLELYPEPIEVWFIFYRFKSPGSTDDGVPVLNPDGKEIKLKLKATEAGRRDSDS